MSAIGTGNGSPGPSIAHRRNATGDELVLVIPGAERSNEQEQALHANVCCAVSAFGALARGAPGVPGDPVRLEVGPQEVPDGFAVSLNAPTKAERTQVHIALALAGLASQETGDEPGATILGTLDVGGSREWMIQRMAPSLWESRWPYPEDAPDIATACAEVARRVHRDVARHLPPGGGELWGASLVLRRSGSPGQARSELYYVVRDPGPLAYEGTLAVMLLAPDGTAH